MSIYKSLLLALSLALLEGCMGWGSTSRIEPFVVRVVDAETGEPLEGVIMLAAWSMYRDSFLGEEFYEYGLVEEFVSNEDGYVGSELPIVLEEFQSSRPGHRSFPVFILYRRGYHPQKYLNVPDTKILYARKPNVDNFNGKTIEISKALEENQIEKDFLYDGYKMAQEYAARQKLCLLDVYPHTSIEIAISEYQEGYRNAIKQAYESSDECESYEYFAEAYIK